MPTAAIGDKVVKVQHVKKRSGDVVSFDLDRKSVV